MQNESEQDGCPFCHWHASAATVLLKSHDGRAFICDVCVMTCTTRIAEAKAKGSRLLWFTRGRRRNDG